MIPLRRRYRLNRRAVLRGALAGGLGVALPLPRLDAMLDDHGAAYADGAALPKLFGVWFFGNGVVPPRWIPTGTGQGDAWQLSPDLMPLAPVKRALTVITGMEIKIALGGKHSTGPVALLTGSNWGKDTATAPSIDQLVAAQLRGDTKFPSVELGVAPLDDAGPLYNYVSWKGENAPNKPELGPRALFQRLFSSPLVPKASDPDATKLARVHQSMLDAVADDLADLRKRVGADDRARLDHHLDAVRTLEKSLTNVVPAGAACALPTKADGDADTKNEAPPAVNSAMVDVLTLALACDLTRVFSFTFTKPGAHVYYRHLGIDKDFHDDVCHAEGGDQPTVSKGVQYAMSCFAELLTRFDGVKEGAGTMLDRACVYATSCIGWGKPHTAQEYPVLIGGLARGALKGDFHLRTDKENTSKAPFTVLQAMGLAPTEFGTGGLRVTSGFPDVLA